MSKTPPPAKPSTPPAKPAKQPGPRVPSRPPGPKTTDAVMYSVKTLAEMWECSRDHIYDLIARGELRTVALGIGRAKTRIPASAVAEFIARKSKGRAA